MGEDISMNIEGEVKGSLPIVQERDNSEVQKAFKKLVNGEKLQQLEQENEAILKEDGLEEVITIVKEKIDSIRRIFSRRGTLIAARVMVASSILISLVGSSVGCTSSSPVEAAQLVPEAVATQPLESEISMTQELESLAESSQESGADAEAEEEDDEGIADEEVDASLSTEAEPSPGPKAPTQEVVEYPEVDFSFKLSDGITNDRKIDYPEGKPFYYGFVIEDKIGDRDGSGSARYTSDFGGETFAQDFSVGYSKYTDRIDDWDKFNKYMTYRNKKSEIDEDGHFFHLVVVIEETNAKGETYNCFLPLDGAVGITVDGETTVYDDDEIPWNDLPKETWELIKDGYVEVIISEGEISGRCRFSDYVQKANEKSDITGEKELSDVG